MQLNIKLESNSESCDSPGKAREEIVRNLRKIADMILDDENLDNAYSMRDINGNFIGHANFDLVPE